MGTSKTDSKTTKASATVKTLKPRPDAKKDANEAAAVKGGWRLTPKNP